MLRAYQLETYPAAIYIASFVIISYSKRQKEQGSVTRGQTSQLLIC